MNSASHLPDLNKLPSILETAEVDDVLRQIMDALDRHADIPPQAAVECMVDAIFARAYRPNEQLDTAVCERILQWIRQQWSGGDVEFAEYATTVLTNLTCTGVDDHVADLLNKEARREVIAELKQCIDERRSFI
jgi:hypothetical protein